MVFGVAFQAESTAFCKDQKEKVTRRENRSMQLVEGFGLVSGEVRKILVS